MAREARVSSALVHYHFATKQRLLEAAGRTLAAERTRRRTEPLQRVEGLDALDALWRSLTAAGADAAERVWHDLLLVARDDRAVLAALAAERERERAALASALPRLLERLGARPSVGSDDLAATLVTFLDGVAVALASGTRLAEVRSAFDAFWLVLVAPGPAVGR